MSKIVESEVVKLEYTSARYDELAPKKVTETNPDFYIFSKKQILEATTPTYRQFLKDAGYADLYSCQRLEIGKGLLKLSDEIRSLAEELNLQGKRKILTGKDGEYIVNINQPNARKLVEGTGYKILTTQLMYNLFIPFIKEEAGNGNEDALNTLEEMTKKAEWLEDLIIDKNKLRINKQEINIQLPKQNSKFNREDLNEFGYPSKLTDNGEFSYWFPRFNKMAVIRQWNSLLDLSCYYGPSRTTVMHGVRQAKFIMEKE